MIPTWKIRREATRLRVQLSGWFSELGAAGRRARYDRDRERLIRDHSGKRPAGPKIAVLLIYQPNGLPASLLRTVDHLAGNGYAVLAVCNMPLTPTDLDRLTVRCWRIVERPNLGYDFGGYRDALWLLDRHGQSPETLILMNDSVWFPLRDGDQLISRMEADPAVFSGAQVFGRADDPAAFEARRSPMFGSYFLFFKRPALQAPAFAGFWRDYRMSSNKEITLRRGERAFSRALLTSGLPCRGVFSQDRFATMIAGLDPEGLDLGLRRLICLDDALETERAGLLAETGRDEGWLAAARSLCLRAAASKNYIGSSPVLSIRDLGFPMIKKNNEMLYTRARRAIVASLDAGELAAFDPTIEAELRAKAAGPDP